MNFLCPFLGFSQNSHDFKHKSYAPTSMMAEEFELLLGVKGNYVREIVLRIAIGCVFGDSVLQGKICVIEQTKRLKFFIWINDGTQN